MVVRAREEGIKEREQKKMEGATLWWDTSGRRKEKKEGCEFEWKKRKARLVEG